MNMKELYIKNLCIEITRRCNMHCAHCMRGDAESVDIPLRHISDLLRHVRHVHHLTSRVASRRLTSGLSVIYSDGYVHTALQSMISIS